MTFNLENLITSNIGLTHTMASVIALVLGTVSLSITKGTALHKKIGYAYAASMLMLLVTAFMIYRLFGGWGIFHWSAVISLLTLIAGLFPMLIKPRPKNHISIHLGFMYWSVIGLYGAFTAEVFVRLPKVIIESGIPNSTFYSMTGIAVGLTMTAGAIFFIKLSSKWKNQFIHE